MFDSLLNSKFYNKCKHAIKCTMTRLDLVRRKKQAMVKFLRKDVADLLTNGLESHAFGRIDELIVEMNQASNYDVIEQYCEYIGKQLNNLQKQSECPREALEAVSTLIFAAARYPDLPELCELRHVFTERYGASIEPFVCSEFIQKLQDKSFTNEEKLLVMQDIAEEFTLPFNVKAIKQKISGVPPNKHDLLKKGSFKGVEVEASERNGHKVDKHAVLERKSKSIPDGREWRQEVQIKPKDIHVVPDCVGQNGEKSRKNYSDKPTEKKHMDNDMLPLDTKRRNGQMDVKKDEKKGGQSWRELMNAEELDLNGSKKQEVAVAKPHQRETKKIVPPYTELKDTEKKDGYHRPHMAGGTDHNRGHADLGLKTLGLEKQGTESASSLNGKTVNKVPPYSKPYRSTSDKSAEDDNVGLYNQARHLGEYGQLVQDRQQMPEKKAFNMRPPPYVKSNTNMNSAHENPTNQAANGYRHNGSEATGHRRDGLVDDDAPRPVSVRRRSSKPPAYGSTHDELTNDEKMENQIPDGRTRRSSSRDRSPYDEVVNDEKMANQTPGGRTRRSSNRVGSPYDEVANDEKMANQTPGGRTRRSSNRDGSPYNEVANDEKMANQTPGGRTRRSSNRDGPGDDYERRKHSSRQNGSASGSDYQTEEDENDNAIDFGNLLPRAPSSHRKHRSRSAHPREGGGHDDDERMMDKLLRHYSKKGMDREEHKTGTKSRVPRPRADQHADGNRDGAPNPPERAVSLPTESGSPVSKPARSVSLQPDTSRGNVHPRMPDFDELAARISAMKRA